MPTASSEHPMRQSVELVPTISGIRAARTLNALRGRAIDTLGHLHDEFGDVFTIEFRGYRIMAIADPLQTRVILEREGGGVGRGPAMKRAIRLLGNGLITSEGPAYEAQNAAVHKSLTPSTARDAGTHAVDVASDVAATWDLTSPVVIDRAASTVALRVAARVLFGRDLTDEESSFVTETVTACRRFYMLPSVLLDKPLPMPSAVRMRRRLAELDDLMETILRDRIAQRPPSQDAWIMADHVVDAAGTAGVPDRGTSEWKFVRDACMTMLLAGHETTGCLVSWAMLQLAHDEAAQDRIRNEEPTSAYLQNFLRETSRNFPSIPVMSRHTFEPIDVGGLVVPANTDVLMSVWRMQRDERFFNNAEQFNPHRFERQARRPAFMPFGAGPRSCIGAAFAMAEAKSAVHQWATEYAFTPVSGFTPEIDGRFTLRARHGIKLHVARR